MILATLMNGEDVVARAAIITSSIVAICCVPQAALADITTCQNAWDFLPRVQISVGNANECGQNNLVFDGGMSKGRCVGPWPSTGQQGADVCYRRTADPLNPNSGLGPWTRCVNLSDITCEIN